jgi:TATA-binding protein-associated factor Taf7
VPLRTSARPPKPSAKKRSLSHYAPRRSKKPKAHSSTVSTIPDPLLSTQSNAELIEISDKEEEQQQQQQQQEEEEQEEDIEDDDAEEEEKEEEARSFKFKTT